MDGTLTHYLDGVQVEEPLGWLDFTEEIGRNFDDRILGVNYPVEVTFTGAAYEQLRTRYLASYCDLISYWVDFNCAGGTSRVVRGQVPLGDVEWNLNKCEARVKVVDDGYGARILNNKDIVVFPTATKTKNGSDITPVAPYDLELFQTGGIAAYTVLAYDWKECMEHMVTYITDGEVAFASSFYDNLPIDERYALVYGYEMRTGDGTALAPGLTFAELYANLWRKYNLWAYITQPQNGSPTLHIEASEDTYSATGVLAFPWQDDLKQSIEPRLLFAKVDVGSDSAEKDIPGNFSLPFVPLLTHYKESYELQGSCNSGIGLDLMSSYVIDNNAIEDVVNNSVDEYDDEVFMVQNDGAVATQSIEYTVNPIYNVQLLNGIVFNRFPLQSNGVLQYASQDAAFQAAQIASTFPVISIPGFGSTTSVSAIVQFDEDFPPNGFDVDNNYGNGTAQGSPVSQANSRYTAAAGGSYVFTVVLRWAVSVPPDPGGYAALTWVVERRNAGGTLISSTTNVQAQITTGNFTDSDDFLIPLSVGDYVQVTYTIQVLNTNLFTSGPTGARLLNGGLFQTNYVITGGGVVANQIDPDAYRSTVYEFERATPVDPWISLREDPTQMISVATDDVSFRRAHVLKATRFIATGETAWELIANRDQPFK